MNEHDGLSASFTDLMTSLAVIFILLLVASTNATVHRYESAKRQSVSNRDSLINNLKKAFPKLDIKGDPRDPLAVIVILPEHLLSFDFDDDHIPEGGENFLEAFVPKLASVVCAKPDTVRSLVVEGHTDEIGKDLHNVELSQRRATAVAKETLIILTERDLQDYTCFLGVMSASGRGSNDLIFDANRQIDEGKSRRVEFHLRVPSFEQRNLPLPATTAAVVQAVGGASEVETRHE